MDAGISTETQSLESLSLEELKSLSLEVRWEALETFGKKLHTEGLSHLHETPPLGNTDERKDTALVLWNCEFGTLGSDRKFVGKLIEFDANNAVLAVDHVDTLSYTWGKTILKVDVSGLGRKLSFLGTAKHPLPKAKESGMGLFVVTFSQMDDAAKGILFEYLFH